jgi:NAD(P)-dependent dehydrogenase (short-subunit alcohol dehydrogenase family)
MDLRNKVSIITGGASGIGAASARAFALQGAKVVVADRNAAGARAVADEIGGLGVACDVAREQDIAALVREAEGAYGPIDVFFSNAGVATGSDPLTSPPALWQEQWEINVMAHVYALRAVLPGMLERGAGYLIHTASMAGILTTHGNAVYATTKHAVVGLAEWLSVTYHDRGIRTSLLAPLGVRTPMLDEDSAWARHAAGPLTNPDQVAAMVLDAVAAELFLILTDPIAQTWMDHKARDLERWLRGMRRLQQTIDADG